MKTITTTLQVNKDLANILRKKAIDKGLTNLDFLNKILTKAFKK